MRRFTIVFSIVAGLAAPAVEAAQCITSKGAFSGYKAGLAQDAQASGVGPRGMQALQSAQLSGITWRFESNPSSQSGTLQRDPATFLAKRSGSSADAFIQRTRSRMAKNPNTFASIEQRFGVPGSVLATIWGLETSWGGYLGETPIVGGAVTLASYCRRHPRFESHAIAALQLVDRGIITANTRGGPSGELGHMQFLAGNWLRYGVDGNGDGRADPYNAVDALASAGNERGSGQIGVM
ncbi:lytic murein transglycosylase [Marinovum algicola]|uniref:lytic murein transglycosylase n=1 Tax=Marinovum algicola TaxID=42444 RepID=UPI0024B8D308|nr:lytic murein transglycosylase [Marinovum algicola]